ncbi:MAG TPA: hypothetical protein VFT98_04620, partial [Myxococcota bacterium]|nr:hypothetical protein [Myxococcota bacterium]
MRNSITSRGSAESRAGRCVFVAAVLFALLPATGARATTLLSVTGAGGDTTGTVLSLYGSALALSFELVGPQIGLDIEVPLTCLQCEARFYLVQNEVGPTSNFVANVRAVTTVSTLAGGGFINRMTTLFTDLTLAAGDYFLVFAPTRDTVSGAIWTATQQ